MPVSDRPKRPRRPNGQAAVDPRWKYDLFTIAGVKQLAEAEGVSPSRWADAVLWAEITRRTVSEP